MIFTCSTGRSEELQPGEIGHRFCGDIASHRLMRAIAAIASLAASATSV
jgi:hypothetical protein